MTLSNAETTESMRLGVMGRALSAWYDVAANVWVQESALPRKALVKASCRVVAVDGELFVYCEERGQSSCPTGCRFMLDNGDDLVPCQPLSRGSGLTPLCLYLCAI
ncbi:hypothetical protein GOP47_0018467 [Adiantum capillus-veneris]|uniref:Uncharacterized protein n=1 Tax=Adiantum capillus-veneris TaxID=13818 RepID=A0A9D4Z865_ADICA|nr:hypothetical protein GOP47_0018467 [Adiantum capillus-veneris]